MFVCRHGARRVWHDHHSGRRRVFLSTRPDRMETDPHCVVMACRPGRPLLHTFHTGKRPIRFSSSSSPPPSSKNTNHLSPSTTTTKGGRIKKKEKSSLIFIISTNRWLRWESLSFHHSPPGAPLDMTDLPHNTEKLYIHIVTSPLFSMN